MINRRGFLQVASAALSVVGIKLPEAKAVAISRSDFPRFDLTAPGTLIPLNTDRPFPALALADFSNGTRIYFDLPCDCMVDNIDFLLDEERYFEIALIRSIEDQAIVVIPLPNRTFGNWQCPSGREFILRKGRFWMTSSHIGACKMWTTVTPLTSPPSPA